MSAATSKTSLRWLLASASSSTTVWDVGSVFCHGCRWLRVPTKPTEGRSITNGLVAVGWKALSTTSMVEGWRGEKGPRDDDDDDNGACHARSVCFPWCRDDRAARSEIECRNGKKASTADPILARRRFGDWHLNLLSRSYLTRVDEVIQGFFEMLSGARHILPANNGGILSSLNVRCDEAETSCTGFPSSSSPSFFRAEVLASF